MIEEIREKLKEAEEKINAIIKETGLLVTGIRLETQNGSDVRVKLEISL